MSTERDASLPSIETWNSGIIESIKEDDRFHLGGVLGRTLSESKTPDTLERLLIVSPPTAKFDLDYLNVDLENLANLTKLPIYRRFYKHGDYLIRFGSLSDERVIGQRKISTVTNFDTDFEADSLGKAGLLVIESQSTAVKDFKEAITVSLLPEPKIADILAKKLTETPNDFRLRALVGVATLAEFEAMQDYNRAYKNLFLLDSF